jgi:hypothetical protein
MIKISKFAILGLTNALSMNEAKSICECSQDYGYGYSSKQERQQKLNDIIKQEIEDGQTHTKALRLLGTLLVGIGGFLFCKNYTDFEKDDNSGIPGATAGVVLGITGIGTLLWSYLPGFSESPVEELVRLQKNPTQNDTNQKRIEELEEEILNSSRSSCQK